jgi:hypothetical protein
VPPAWLRAYVAAPPMSCEGSGGRLGGGGAVHHNARRRDVDLRVPLRAEAASMHGCLP